MNLLLEVEKSLLDCKIQTDIELEVALKFDNDIKVINF